MMLEAMNQFGAIFRWPLVMHLQGSTDTTFIFLPLYFVQWYTQ
jgi:hypothetical protein